jgi:hypothetical protein
LQAGYTIWRIPKPFVAIVFGGNNRTASVVAVIVLASVVIVQIWWPDHWSSLLF